MLPSPFSCEASSDAVSSEKSDAVSVTFPSSVAQDDVEPTPCFPAEPGRYPPTLRGPEKGRGANPSTAPRGAARAPLGDCGTSLLLADRGEVPREQHVVDVAVGHVDVRPE